MSLFIRKFIALLLVVWLPLFTGSAMALSVPVLVPHGECHEMAMDDMDAAVDMAADTSDDCCNPLCHLACGGYLNAREIRTPDIRQTGTSVTPYQFSFHSVTEVPLDPPPLA